MSAIKPYGRFYELTPEGYIVNPARFEHIKPPWFELVNAIKSAYLDKYTDHLHSIYVRGSVPHGWAIEGVSDADSFALLKPGAEGIRDVEGEYEIEAQLEVAFPFTTGVEFHTLPFSEIQDPRSIRRFIIKVESLCIHGQDLSMETPLFKLDKAIAFQARHFSRHLGEFVEKFPSADDASTRRSNCAWIMKRIVRSGFELVMVRAGQYTRDLYPCYVTFSKFYPEREPQMKQALEWAVVPVDESSVVMAFVEEFGGWLRREIEQTLNLT
ncbi:hypothetical protein HY009_08400 [Candidatus Acetothermia bacterium]|nr:hypothetical protein [Candidatus Acetothermia bacterium]